MQRVAAEAAEKMDPEATRMHLDQLGQLARHEDLLIRSPAMRTLIKIGDDAVPFMIAALEAEDDEVQSDAIESLAKLGAAAEPALPKMEQIAKNPNNPYLAGKAKTVISKIRATMAQAKPSEEGKP